MSSFLSIRLFDGFHFEYEGQVIDLAGQLRPQELLVYLLLHRHTPQQRQHVAFLFWPESSEKQARTNLRSLWHRLRTLLPDADRYLYADATQLGWRPEIAVALDVAQFEEHVQQAGANAAAKDAVQIDHLRQAIHLYRGELFPVCYSEWLLLARERLHSLYLQAIDRIIGLLEAQREYESAIRYGELRLQQDLLHEATYRRLMHLHALNSDRSRALRIYHDCIAVLEQELGVAPMAATQELYARLRHGVEIPAKMPATPGRSPLVGRQSSWHTLLRCWHRLADGQTGPHFVLISGEAGVGKTRLAEEFLVWARRQGATTGTARCYPGTQPLALMPVAAWLRELSLDELSPIWLQEISRLLPELATRYPQLTTPAPLQEQWQQLRFFQALAHAVRTQRQPLLLLLDDVQWCDEETLRWLAYLLQVDVEIGLLIIATCRSEAVMPRQLLQLHEYDGWTQIRLGRLDERETVTLAGNLAGDRLPPDLIHHLYRQTEGNPLFVVETVRAGLPDRTPPAVGELNEADELPQAVRNVLTWRLAQLSPLAQEVVGVAAVIGRSFTFPILVYASGEDETTVIEAVEELWQRRIIHEQGRDAYDFTHGKLRQVAYEQLNPSRRRWVHRRVGEALAALHEKKVAEVSGQIAIHFELAGETARAIDYNRQAGEQMQDLFANEQALDYYDRALKLLATSAGPRGDTGKQKVQILERKGRLLQLMGRKKAARSAFVNALDLLAADEVLLRCRLQRLVGDTYKADGRYPSALRAYHQAEDLLDDPALRTSEQWLEWIGVQQAKMSVHYGQGQAEEMAILAEEVAPILEHYGTPQQRVEFLLLRSRTALRDNRYAGSDEAHNYAQEAYAISQQVGDLSLLAESRFSLAFIQLWRGDTDEAEANFQQALAACERTGDHYVQVRCLTYLVTLYRLQGDRDSVQAYAPQSLAVAEAGDWASYVGAAKANLAWLSWCDGTRKQARELAEAALSDWAGSVYPFQWLALWLLVDDALVRQEMAMATRYAARLLDNSQQRLPASITAALAAAITATENGQTGDAARELRRAVDLAQTIGQL